MASGRVQDGADASPQAVLIPAAIATIQRVPRAERGRHLAPRGAGVHDPEHALQQAPVVEGGAPARRFLGRQEGRHLLPEDRGQLGGPRDLEDRHGPGYGPARGSRS